MVVGTVAYMSPEQAEGRPVDARSDIFSFGSLLYEIVTGRRAFERSSYASTLTAILRDDPPRANSVAPDIPAGIMQGTGPLSAEGSGSSDIKRWPMSSRS